MQQTNKQTKKKNRPQKAKKAIKNVSGTSTK